MEEITKKRRLPNRVSKGQFFRGLDPLTDAQRSFIAEWYPWAMKYAETDISRRKSKNDLTPPEIIRDTAVTALIYAAISWKPEGGASFKTYFHYGFYTRISHAVKRYHEDNEKTVSENQKTKSQHEGDHGCTTVANTLYSIEDTEDSIVSNIYIDRLLSHLTPHQREIVTRYCLEGEKQSEIARELGVTKQAVSQTVRIACNTLRGIMIREQKEQMRGCRTNVQGYRHE